MIKKIFTLNFLDSFVFGITTIAIPLLMLERSIGIAAIGLVFSLAPIAKMLVRLAAAGVADSVGERRFYVLNGLANFSQSVAYALSSSALGFGLGKAIDGARESLIWAVNRSTIFHEQPERRHFATADMVSGRAIYFAFGSLAVGLLFPFGGYVPVLILCAAIGLTMAALSLSVRNTPHRERVRLSDITMLGKERRFYETAGAITFGAAFYMVILYLMVPIFFKLAGFSTWQIGILYAAYFLIFGVAMSLLSRRKASSRWSAAIGSAIFIICLCGMGFAPASLAPYFFLFMAVGDAHLGINWEEIIYLQAARTKKRSTEIALLHAPSSVAIFLLSGISGFAVEQWGFAPLFVLGAATLAIFAWWAVRLSEMKG